MSDCEYIGLPVEELDTPSLLVDLDDLQFNLDKMAAHFSATGKNLRPHIKSHKTPAIALKQIEAGAIGICCAKLGEAEVMADAGVQDILIANEVVGRRKMPRLTELAKRCDIMVAVDDERNIADIARAAGEAGVKPRVVVECNIGHDRSGATSAARAVELCKLVENSLHLRWAGIMGYEGHIVDLEDAGERERGARESLDKLVAARTALEAAGMTPEIVSSSATGDYYVTTTYEGITEVQAGSYALMDAAYGKLGLGFRNALTCLATVTSRPSPEHVITDAGMKTLAPEHGLPEVVLPEGWDGPGAATADPKGLRFLEFWKLSEEHGRLLQKGGDCTLEIGDTMRFIPGHVCTTMNLHDEIYATRDGRVVDVWPITGRGKVR